MQGRPRYADRLAALRRDHGLTIGVWASIDDAMRADVLALVLAPDDDNTPLAFLRPDAPADKAHAVLDYIEDSLNRLRADDPDVFQSYEPNWNRRVAIVYDKGRSDAPGR